MRNSALQAVASGATWLAAPRMGKKSTDEMTPDEVAHFFERWPQPMYAQPGSYRPTSDGFHIDRPHKEVSFAAQRDENDIVAMHRSVLTVVPDFPLTGAQAGKTSDWAVDVVTGDGTDAMTVTIAHGSPYSFHRLTRGDVSFGADRPLEVFERSADGRSLGLLVHAVGGAHALSA